MILEMSLAEKKKLCEKLKAQLSRQDSSNPVYTSKAKTVKGNNNAAATLSQQQSQEEREFDDDLNAFMGEQQSTTRPAKKRKLN